MDGNMSMRRDPETGELVVEQGLAEPARTGPLGGDSFTGNLALDISENKLDSLSDMLTENVANDEDVRSGWEQQQQVFLDLLGLQVDSELDDDGEDMNRSSHPLMLTALLRFQAKALSALLPSDAQVVNTLPAMDLDDIEEPDKRAEIEDKLRGAQRRVGRFYAEYFFERLPTYEEDTDLILHDMGLMGVGLRKIVVDRTRTVTPVIPEYVSPADLIVGFHTRSFRAGRYAHRMNVSVGDLIRRIQSGTYRAVQIHDQDALDLTGLENIRNRIYGMSPEGSYHAETHRVYETYADLYLDDDMGPLKLPRPYIVTIHAATRKVLSIQRNWRQLDPDETAIEHFVPYIYHPGRTAISGIGLGQLLGSITMALRDAQRSALQSAYLQNHASGFKLSNLTIRDGGTRLQHGEFVDVDSPTNDIRSAIMPHIFQGPSPGLMQLSDKMEQNGQQLGGIASIDFAALMKSGVAVAPAMAALEESTEFQTSVHRRLYKAHRKELDLVHERMQALVGNRPVPFSAGNQTLQPGDLKMVKVVPFMKPGQASRQKVILEAQSLYEMAKAHPDMMDLRKAIRGFVEAMSAQKGDEVMLPDPLETPPTPADPVTEYSMALAGKPIAAGPAQDHAAHIAAHAAQMKVVETSQLPIDIGERVMAALGAHIAEHMAMMLAAVVSAKTGVPPEQMSAETPPEVEAKIAPLLAQAIEAFAAENATQEADDGTGRERVKAEAQITLQQMKQQHEKEMAEMKRQHAIELQRAKDDAAMSRELEDNAAAMLIAEMKGGAKTAGAEAAASA